VYIIIIIINVNVHKQTKIEFLNSNKVDINILY